MPDIAITGIQFTRKPAPTSVLINATVGLFDVLSVDPASPNSYIPANAKTADAAKATYIAMSAGIASQYILVIPITSIALLVGDALTQGLQYVVSTNAGKIAPRTDLVTGEFITELFLADAGNVIRMSLDITGIAVP